MEDLVAEKRICLGDEGVIYEGLWLSKVSDPQWDIYKDNLVDFFSCYIWRKLHKTIFIKSKLPITNKFVID